MVRSQLLRGFDRQCVDKIEHSLIAAGVNFIRNAVPTRLEKREEDGKIVVHYERDGVQLTVRRFIIFLTKSSHFPVFIDLTMQTLLIRIRVIHWFACECVYGHDVHGYDVDVVVGVVRRHSTQCCSPWAATPRPAIWGWRLPECSGRCRTARFAASTRLPTYRISTPSVMSSMYVDVNVATVTPSPSLYHPPTPFPPFFLGVLRIMCICTSDLIRAPWS
jgi:hypothetical protein